MQFRPCIDIHNGKVKQIVGGSLRDEGDYAKENFVSEKGAEYYAELYRDYGLKGGHIILLNGKDSEYYEATKNEALKGLHAYPGGMQIGGGITDENAEYFIENGASHVVVTSYLFVNGRIDFDRLRKLAGVVGREHVVVDLSCRHYDDGYHIMTDRWQTKTEEILDFRLLEEIKEFCDEFLIHAVDVEGSASGIESNLVESLRTYNGCPVTYAGGVHSYDDIKLLRKIGDNRVHVTIGSALDLFGGNLDFEEVIRICAGII